MKALCAHAPGCIYVSVETVISSRISDSTCRDLIKYYCMYYYYYSASIIICITITTLLNQAEVVKYMKTIFMEEHLINNLPEKRRGSVE